MILEGSEDTIRLMRSIIGPVWDQLSRKDMRSVSEGGAEYLEFRSQYGSRRRNYDNYDLIVALSDKITIIDMVSMDVSNDIKPKVYSWLLSDPNSIPNVQEKLKKILAEEDSNA